VIDLINDFPPACATDCTIACHHELNLSLNDEDCSTEILPTHLLSGLEPGCNDDRYFQVMLTDAYGNVIDPPIVTQEHIGQRLTYKVTNFCENSCWGYLNVEFKLGPVIDCSDVQTSCLVFDMSCDYFLPEVTLGCGTEVLGVELTGQRFDFMDFHGNLQKL